jgi:hypothetical protein
MAFAEMHLILAQIAWTFDFSLAPDSLDYLNNIKVYNLQQKPPLNVYFTKRRFEKAEA